jgi:hypothetical protein
LEYFLSHIASAFLNPKLPIFCRMSQPDLVKAVTDTWVVARDTVQNSFQAGCTAWTTHVEPKAREMEQSLKQKMGDAQRFFKEKTAQFSKQDKSPST